MGIVEQQHGEVEDEGRESKGKTCRARCEKEREERTGHAEKRSEGANGVQNHFLSRFAYNGLDKLLSLCRTLQRVGSLLEDQLDGVVAGFGAELLKLTGRLFSA